MPAQVKDWQPIETAPRDSRRLLVYCPTSNRPICEAWWSLPYEAAPLDCCWWQTMDGVMLSADVHHGPSGKPLGATHWMPLPDPPKAQP